MSTSYHQIYSFLSTECTSPVRDPVWGTVLMPPSFMQLLTLPVVQKLARIRQLGPTYLVYPGAVHTRLNHSIGVYEIAKRMMLVLMQQQSPSEAGPFTIEGVRAFLSAALLHDIGHFPYTHSLKDLPLTSHETLAARIIMEQEDLKSVITDRIGSSPAQVAAIIDDSIRYDDAEIALYRSMLSGTLDPDKLDYLNRDALFCGVPYGLQDVDFILTKIRLTENGNLGIMKQGIGSIEHLLFSKYLMYRNIYWNKSVRSATAMIRKALCLGLEEGVISPNDLYGLDDSQFTGLLRSKGYQPFSIIDLVNDNRLFRPAATLASGEFTGEIERLRDYDTRIALEEELRSLIARTTGATLSPWEVIIDIPEPISLETEVPIIGRDGFTAPFLESGPVFTRSVIDRFTKSLTTIRIFLPEGIAVDRSLVLELLN